MLKCPTELPLRPPTLTLRSPGPASVASTSKTDLNVDRTPCSTPGPVTLIRLADDAQIENGLPAVSVSISLQHDKHAYSTPVAEPQV